MEGPKTNNLLGVSPLSPSKAKAARKGLKMFGFNSSKSSASTDHLSHGAHTAVDT